MADLNVNAASVELSERGYMVRHAAETDLPRLSQLEELCWQHTRTSQQQLRVRLQRYPDGQFVLERDSEILGVIYSQRIVAVDALASRSAANVHELHDESGSTVQLLAVNVDPQTQNLSLGDQLLEFVLQRCAVLEGVDRVVGVTLCKRFDAGAGVAFDEYIHRQDDRQDPVLAFHRSHGATVVGSIANYRPEDAANQHYGVLVSYDIHNRQSRHQSDQSETRAPDREEPNREELERVIRAEVVRMIGDEQACDGARPLMEMGLSSADLLQLQLQMERQFGRKLRPGFFFEHNSIDKVIAYFAGGSAAPAHSAANSREVSQRRDAASRDIAIVGMSCRLPGGIETPDDLWRTLAATDCVISTYPKSRGNWPSAADYPGIDQGGYLVNGDAFDASFFRVTPAEAQVTDPQQRILLELAWSCLEDAGMLPADLRGTRTGVFVGASNCDYSRLIQASGIETEAHHATGSSLAIIANRLSYFFDLSGPSMLIDTACSSSLVAFHSAIQSLHAVECTTALVGGVNFLCHPELSVAYHKAGMLAADGRCKVFDARANGYVRAEGAVMLLLKPLSEAIRARDNIHAVIKGSAVNHGGLSGGLTVPDPKKQSELLVAAWNSAGIAPHELSYIEAHGTGTPLGDPIEVQGIQTAYASASGVGTHKTCAMGSIKGNLGHLESAAGITGILKVVLSMKHRQLPGQPTFSTLNPKIALDDSPFHIAERHRSWDAGGPRLAGVSSFGSGGANAHCVVQEYVAEEDRKSSSVTQGDHLFVISAADQSRLRDCATRVADWCATTERDASFSDAIYTWQVGRTAMKRRLAIKVKDAVDLRDKLQRWLSEPSSCVDTWSGEVSSRDPSVNRSWQGEAARQQVAQALVARDLDQLAALWTAGAEIDWRKLYAASDAQEPRRISVPTYAFARERHWIDGPAIEASQQLLMTPVWELASAHDASRGGGFIEHRIVLCEMPEMDAESVRASARSHHCAHLQCQGESQNIGGRYVAHALACFEEVKRMLAGKPRGRALLQVVITQQHGTMLLAGLSGLLSTATRENPNFVGQIVMTDAACDSSSLAEQLRHERDLSSDTLIKYAQGQRYAQRWQEVRAREPSLPAFKHDGVYVITGGLGGLGQVFAKEIFRHAARPRIVLTGRSSLTAEQQQKLAELATLAAESGGFAPEYRQLDPIDPRQTRAVIASIANDHQRIDGIIHCAGMISDNFILKKTAEEFERVLAPKVAGTINLDEASKDLRLDFLVLFSSFVSALGNVGQADYAAANGFMDQFAAHRNLLVDAGQRQGQTLSIQWPFWQEGGMAMDQESLETLRATTGMRPMHTDVGLQAFHTSLLSRQARVLVLEGDVEKLRQTMARANQISTTIAVAEASTAFNSELLREATLRKVKQLFGEAIKLSATQVKGDEPLTSYGLDSILINAMNRRLAEVFGEISKTLFFEHRTLAEIAAHLVEAHEARCIAWTGSSVRDVPRSAPARNPPGVVASSKQAPPSRTHQREPIAIIGVSGIYPQAASIEEFWENLASGRNCVGEIPPERWPLDGFYVADMEQAVAEGKSYSKWGGFIEQFAQFEPLFFNISPREALNMDPQERLFLQEAWRALEHAGYTRADLKHRFQRKVGVFAGITKTGFEWYATPAAAVDDGFFPRTSFSSVANRVSYFLDLTGPSLPIDTMCSSSLTAIHEACEHIARGDCELAFAGGVNLYLHPATYTWLCSQQMLSRDGLCRSFGAGGNGYVPGEGVGVVLLKSLSAAQRDNDHIHGIILATHVNHGGKANGYTVPSPRAQAELIGHTINKAGITADDISYMEAHGTGTELGDPIELSGLQQAFVSRAGATSCALGSAKSNIGHLEAAAGIAGLTKVLLQMKHQAIAPSLHATQLNPNIDFDKSAFRLNRNLTPWLAREQGGGQAPRIAGISSFGAGGANAHIIVQEFLAADGPVRRTEHGNEEQHAFVLSAGTTEQLQQRARDLLSFVQAERREIDLRSLAYTLQVGREAMEARLGILASSIDQLVDRLTTFLGGVQDIEDVYQGQVKGNKETLRLFGGDEDFHATLDRWLARRKFSKLLELWTKGLEVRWDQLYEVDRPRRMALPTYPFAKERYWIDQVSGVRAWDAPAVAATVHPLLHTNTSDLIRQSYTSVFTGEEFFLRDHKVQDRKVLPAVAYLEMARAAVDLASPERTQGSILELHHTAWLQPIAVSSSKEVVIALYLSDSEPTAIDFEIHSTGVDDQTVHCQGEARWVESEPLPAIDIQQLKAGMSRGRLDVAEFYENFTRMGITYGPAHRAVAALYLGEQQLLAELNLPAAVESTRSSYLLHPSLMDSALQGCLALIGDAVDQRRPLLPFALDTLRVIAPCSTEMVAWVRRTQGATSVSDQFKFDVDLCDRQGNVCVQMRGFCSRTLEVEGKDDAANTAQLYSLVPVWNRASREHQDGDRERSPAHVLLLGSEQVPLDWLLKSYPQAEFLQLPENASIASIQERLEQRTFERLLWIAPDVFAPSGAADDSPATIVAAQEQGVLAVFRIAKALLNLHRGDGRLDWTLITRNTQSVTKTDRIAPTHGGLAGLVGSLAREYPEWNLQLLDVDDVNSLSAGQCLSLPWGKRGHGLAHRRGEWFVEGLAQVGALPESPPAYRHGGVYVVIGGAGGIGEAWSRFMVEHYQAELVWIGRRPLDAAIEDKLQALGQLGPMPRYFSADATSLESLQAAREQIRAVHSRVHGVVHSAIVLRDQSFSRMEEATFRSSLAAKVDVSVHMDAVFGDQDLDFMLFFSSLISFTRAPGQSNYAAGCTFKDSFAHALSRRRRYPIKIVNWGYWGNVGVVATDFYNSRMQRLGLASIEAQEAMDALQTFVSSDVKQLVLVKAVDSSSIEEMRRPETVSYVAGDVSAVLSSLRERVAAGQPPEALKDSLLPADVSRLAEQILAATLAAGNGRRPKNPLLGRWLDASIDYLQREGALSSASTRLDELWAAWDAHEASWQKNPNTRAHLALLKACLQALPEILSGARQAADVMFPESSLHLVAGVYSGNAVSDYYNDVLGRTLCACIQQRLQANPSSKLRILEIGAGTGGTTRAVLPMLREFDGGIEEYCYTDLSKAFLIHAEEAFRPVFPALRTALFDASKPLASQSVAANRYDFVIATNVLHATADIRETLRNVKALLPRHGVVLLNEMCGWSLFNHLTFGLLDGWWLYEDTELRLPGSPGLEPESWSTVLADEGFEAICFPAEQAHALGQQIIVASSDGQVRQRVPEPERVSADTASKRSVVAKPKLAPHASFSTDVPRTSMSLRDKAVAYLQGVVAKALRMEPSELEPSRPLAEYGLDSIVVVGVTSQLRRVFPGVTSTLFFEVRTIDGFADYLLEKKKQDLIALVGGEETAPEPRREAVPSRSMAAPGTIAPARSSRRARPQAGAAIAGAGAAVSGACDVAIVGLAGRYPQAVNLSEFWNNLASGRNCITEVPQARWDWQEYFDAERGKAGKIYTKWGGFLEDIDGFDPLFFRISPKEAKAMDPQERLFLEACYHAIEDAGHTPASLGDIDKVGVFVGVMNSRYSTQPLHYSIANRVSYVLNFQGPSLAVDTACSASLTAIHLALESIYSGSSECAIAGGVNLIIDPVHYLELSALTMLSAGNQCKSFGNEADGFVDAEGVGAIVLKPLSKAERDGDHIYAVIKGSAVNAGGKTNGYTVPNPQAQTAVIAKALQRANIAASDISYVEAHGTGTALGDPIEISGLTRAFEQSTRDQQFCAIGSLKSNIGHCESAAGIAGLTKVLLQLQHKQLVPSLHADVPNPEIDFDRTPFKVQRALAAWARPRREVDGVIQEVARTAGISSFGAGGANAHIVVQEHEYPTAAGAMAGKVIVPLSARTTEQLRSKAIDLLSFLRSRTTDVVAVAHTLQVGREPMDERLALVSTSIDELAAQLESFIASDSGGEGAYRGRFKRSQGPASTSGGVEEALTDRNLPRLAELWTQGATIDWSKLYGDSKPRRISLPAYPFAKDRYWRETIDVPNVSAKRAAESTLHPLLHRNVSDVRQLAYRSAFSGSESFLADYPAAGTMMPPAVFLEMVRAAIENATAVQPNTCKALELFNVVWADGVTIKVDQAITVALFARDDDQLDYEIYSQHQDGDSVHLQGQSMLGTEPRPIRIDIAGLRNQMQRGERSSSVFYDVFADAGVHYGPIYHGVTATHHGDRQLLAEIEIPETVAGERAGEMMLHPVVMDCALQAAVDLIAPARRPLLPLALESLRVFAACADRMFAWVRYSRGESMEQTNTQLDIDLLDADGNVRVQMRGLTYQVEGADAHESIASIDPTSEPGKFL